MLIDRTHRSWAIGSGAALAVAAVGYVGSVAVSDRPWSGGSAVGLAYGIAGFAMMVFAGCWPRKKVPAVADRPRADLDARAPVARAC